MSSLSVFTKLDLLAWYCSPNQNGLGHHLTSRHHPFLPKERQFILLGRGGNTGSTHSHVTASVCFYNTVGR